MEQLSRYRYQKKRRKCLPQCSLEGSCSVEDRSKRMCVLDWHGRAMHLLTLSVEMDIVSQEVVDLGIKPLSVTLSQGHGILSQDQGALSQGHGNLFQSHQPELVVTEAGSCEVRTYDHQGQLLRRFTAPHKDCSPAGCAIKLGNGELVTREGNAGKLVWSDETGRRLREYPSSTESKEICGDPLENVDQISCFLTNPPPDEQLSTMCPQNQKHGIQWPFSMKQDMNGDIIASYRHGVMLISHSGTFIRDVIKDGDVQNPRCLHLASNGCLYVADHLGGEKTLKVIKYIEEGVSLEL